ncbi:MAG: hypothetical protein R3B36_31885 [Polyangiaceae bacterium]
MRLLTATAAFALVWLADRTADACAVCGAADKALPANGNEVPFSGRKRAIVEGRGASFATLGRDVSVQEVRAEATSSVALGPSTMVGVSAPLVLRAVTSRGLTEGATLGAPRADARVERAMPGDVELRAAHTAYRSRPATIARRLTLGLTLKLPTAPIDRDARGAALHPDLQPGCGSIVPWVSATYGWSAALWSAWSSAGFLLPASVRDGPHPGASLRASATLQLQPTTKLATRLGVHGRWDGAGELDDEVVKASGGAAVHVAPEIVLSPTTDVVVSLGASFPAIQAMRGYRSTSPVVLASVGLDF